MLEGYPSREPSLSLCSPESSPCHRACCVYFLCCCYHYQVDKDKAILSSLSLIHSFIELHIRSRSTCLLFKMPRMCCVYDCKSGYRSCAEKVTVYRFPSNLIERQRWVDAIPNKLDHVNLNTAGVCQRHWSDGFPTIKRGRFESPAVPPNKWPESIPQSNLRTVAAPRTSKNWSTNIRQESLNIDEDPAFQQLDLFRLHDATAGDLTSSSSSSDRTIPVLYPFKQKFKDNVNSYGLLASNDNEFMLLSQSRTGSIHSFSVYFELIEDDDGVVESVLVEGYIGLKKATIPHVQDGVMKRWSQLTEVLRFFKVSIRDKC